MPQVSRCPFSLHIPYKKQTYSYKSLQLLAEMNTRNSVYMNAKYRVDVCIFMLQASNWIWPFEIYSFLLFQDEHTSHPPAFFLRFKGQTSYWLQVLIRRRQAHKPWCYDAYVYQAVEIPLPLPKTRCLWMRKHWLVGQCLSCTISQTIGDFRGLDSHLWHLKFNNKSLLRGAYV